MAFVSFMILNSIFNGQACQCSARMDNTHNMIARDLQVLLRPEITHRKIFPITSLPLAGKDGKDRQGEKNNALAVPRLSVCADGGKVDRARLCTTEVRVMAPQTTERRQTQVR